ncbi:MAG: phage tail tape measure protein [Gammaproteobacteria bacterium]|uniref:Putative tail protein n=1 Tax=viral metagenome TaxID=1070528 RepID=A0A6M3KKZ6_9ZZZZ|nr:phage tail tape measure protein [Gammaproteobacteria bacterium]MBU1505955.1 phage tail tape measure protein [Gammaproteobacteria bacterium]MBU2119883.1 phage tail tape measure protein [Gammaproteobacteria bacterium]MBU2189739.1 phage tail tape measure protein [Gammaproteobacteria bacterium]
MADQLRLRVVLDMAERVLAPMKRISGASGETARALKAARDRLKELNDQQAAVGNVQKHAAELARLNNALKVKQALLDGMRASGTATAAQIKREENGVRKLADALEVQKAAAVKARAALNAMGVTGNLGAAQARLKTDIEGATAAMGRQRAELQRLATQQRQLQTLRDKHAKAMLHTGMVAGTGVAMQAAGRKGVELSMGPVGHFSQHQDAMLGIARQVPGARDEMGQLTEVYRQAERDVRALSGQIPMATTEITKMMTAAARMEVPTGELKEFTLLASEMATAFDAVPDEVTESMGKVAKNFKIPLTSIRGLADSINYLDDNAISKGADIIDFLNRTSGVVSTVAMSAQDAAALGSTLLTLGERTETAGTAANAIVQKFAAATKGTKKFRSALDEIGLSAEAVQMGMSKDATGTLDKVIAAIGKLPEHKRIGVMVELVGMEHSDTLAKLVDKPDELERQRALANGSNAKGSMGREAAARNATLSAQWQMTKNRAFNLSAVVGQSLEPALLALLNIVNPLLEKFMAWTQANAGIVKWVLGAAVAVSALVAALGFVLVPLALIAGKALLLRFVFARLSLGLFGAKAAAGAAATGMGLLYRVGYLAGRAFALLRGGAGVLLMVLRTVAVFLLANPIVAAIAAIAGAAFMVWRNWDGIKGGLLAIWQQLSTAVGAWWASTAAGAAALWQDLVALKDQFFTAGADLMGGLVNGITSRLGSVREAVVGAADALGAWFREKLGIASPSRVFMQYGGWISEGAALGITGGQGAVRSAALAMATAATAGMPMAADAAAMRLDTRPPLSAAGAMAPAGGGGGNTYNITINAAPGMDEKAMVRAMTAELDRRNRAGRSRVLSSMHDID